MRAPTRILWAQTYDRDLADVFAIQSEIAKAIADQLQAQLSPTEKTAIEKPPTDRPGGLRPLHPGQDSTSHDIFHHLLVNKTCGRQLSFLTRQ